MTIKPKTLQKRSPRIDPDPQRIGFNPVIRQASKPVDLILARLKNVRPSTDRCDWLTLQPIAQFSALCPGHGDTSNSLSISHDVDGNALVHCHADCSAEEIMTAIGLGLQHLYALKSRRTVRRRHTQPRYISVRRNGGAQ